MKTGRIIESYNARSKFVLKEGEGHSEVAKYWLGYLKYVLQFSKFHNRGNHPSMAMDSAQKKMTICNNGQELVNRDP
jgi:hypothetical protein